MRLREILPLLIEEAKTNHWDASRDAWKHQREECRTCAAAVDAQHLLTVNFVDLDVGDLVSLGMGAFGTVDRIRSVADVRVGVSAGNRAFEHALVVQADVTRLTRLGRDG